MSGVDKFLARAGGNIVESMGGGRGADPGAAGPAPFHGETTAKYRGAARIKDALAIEVDRLAPDPDQPRKDFDPETLADLAASLKARGQLQPIRVRWEESVSRWIIVAGERRYRAAILAGLPTLMAVEAKGAMTADDILEDQLVENALREDLRPIEQARAFRALIDRRGWTYRQLAERLHVAPASVARALALLDLPADVQDQVEAGAVPASAAYEVARVEDDEDRRELAARVAAGEMTRDDVAAEVRRRAGRSAGKGRGAGKAKPRKATERRFRTSAGYRFTVECRRGIEAPTLREMLLEVLGQIDAELGDSPADAA